MREDIISILRSRNISITIPRIEILNYLLHTKNHPSAEEIYNHMLKICPNISRATVYNNIASLKEAGIIQEITIEKDRARYDSNLKPHAHFLCNVCKTIIDIDMEGIVNLSDLNFGNLSINSCHIYFYGLCENCSSQEGLQLLSMETCR